MATRIKSNHPNTRQFLWYVVSTIAETKGLQNHSLVAVPMQRGKTPFPEFQEYDHGFGPEYSAKEMIWRGSPDYDKNGEALNQYFTENIRGAVPTSIFKRTKGKTLTYPLTMTVFDLIKVYEQYQKLKLEKIPKFTTKKLPIGKPSQLLKNPLRILFRGKETPILEGSKQHDVCKIMFSKPLNTAIELDRLVDAVYTGEEITPKDKLKNIQNALYDVNQKVKKVTGKSIFSIGSKRFRKIA